MNESRSIHSDWPAGAALAALLTLLPPIAACTRGPDADAEPREVRSEVERGPVRVSVVVEPAKATLADRPTMTVRIDHLPGVSVEKPEFPGAIGDLRVLDIKELEPRIQDGREIVEQVLTLEPTRTGKMAIFPVDVYFTDARPEGDGKPHEMATEPLAIDVGSVVPGEVRSLDELRAASPPVGVPGAIPWPVAAALLAALLVAAGVVAWRMRRRREVAQAKILTPQERAILDLEKLWESGLADRDVKIYYLELTGIVRRYVEATTGIRAPEQTTEEFLHEIGRRNAFPPEEQRRFKGFLEAADLVKFAAHRPHPGDIEASYQRAREFVGYNVREEVPV